MDDDSNVNDDGNIVASRIILAAEDDHPVLVDCWLPTSDGAPTAVIQILHGLGEHAARYERFARTCAANGIAVAAHNHRGHGEACPADSLGHFADHAGWDKIISETRRAVRSWTNPPSLLRSVRGQSSQPGWTSSSASRISMPV